MAHKSLEAEQQFELTLSEITYSLRIDQEWITEIVEEGIITPLYNAQKEWVFDHEAFRRIHTVVKLQRDLGINTPGAALVMELLDEIEKLRMFIK